MNVYVKENCTNKGSEREREREKEREKEVRKRESERVRESEKLGGERESKFKDERDIISQCLLNKIPLES